MGFLSMGNPSWPPTRGSTDGFILFSTMEAIVEAYGLIHDLQTT